MDSDQQLLEEEKTRNNNMVSSSTTGFCYSDDVSSNNQIQNHLLNQIHTFSRVVQPGIFNSLTPSNMESFFTAAAASGKHGNINQTVLPSSSKPPISFYHDDEDDDDDEDEGDDDNDDQNHLMETVVTDHDHSASWQHHENNRLNNNNNNSNIVDDSSLRCVFTCEGNERPSQGLSLSLSSTNPSSIGLQSFELRQHQQQQQHHHHNPMLLQQDHHQNHRQQDFRFVPRDGSHSKPHVNMIQNHRHQQQEEYQLGHQFHLRNSKFLGPAQELLNEFCCLGTKQNELPLPVNNKPLIKNNNQWEQDDQHGCSKKQNVILNPHELIELQKRKSKLLSMLEEVDRRYKHYCDQMKAVVSSFEAVAGNGAAKVYSALASKAMSRHFRCLRDGIVGQIQETNKAMGEKDTASVVAPGTTKGETPRLRLLDQTLRQQRAIQQMSLMESHPWRPQRGLPERSVSVLRAWLFEHFLHPYPSDVDKHILARQTGLSRSQVSNWFINARVRLWKPMVEEMYVEETKEHLPINTNNNNLLSSDLQTALVSDDFLPCQNPNNDKKPTPDQLLRIDSECLSSIISPNSGPKHDARSKTALQHHQNQITFGRVSEPYMGGGMELDFSSYSHHSASNNNAVGYDGSTSGGHGHHQFGGSSTGGGGGGGVSLTLGLQQHGGSNNFGLGSHQETMFYTRDHHNMIDDCTQTVPYSILDGEGQNLPYRNLLGAQLLHDLAG